MHTKNWFLFSASRCSSKQASSASYLASPHASSAKMSHIVCLSVCVCVCLSVCWTQMNEAQHELVGLITRAGICVPPTVTYLPYLVSRSTLTAVGRSQLLARWPGTHSRILSTIQRAAQTALGVYLKRTCSRVTSASSALAVLNDYAPYKSTHSVTSTRVMYLGHVLAKHTNIMTHSIHCVSKSPLVNFWNNSVKN